jgi:hypothetical protein
MRAFALLLLLGSTAAFAADTAKLLKRTERGDESERIEALKDLGKADAALAVDKATQWLTQQNPRLRAAAARELWDLKDAAKPAETALRAALSDRDEDTVYNAIGALDGMDVPDSDLREARLAIAQNSRDAFHVFYAARALYPDPALKLGEYLDACFDAANLLAEDRISDTWVRGHLQDALFDQLNTIAKKGGRAAFDAMMDAWQRESPPVRYQISRVLSAVPTSVGDPVRLAALMDGAPKNVRGFLLSTLSGYGAKAQPVLDAMLDELRPNNEVDVRKDAASALGRVADPPGSFTDQIKPSAWRTQVETRIAPALAKAATTDPVTDVRKEAAEALQRLGTWGGPALPILAPYIAKEPDASTRHALTRVCWSAREAKTLPREVLQQLAASDPDEYVRNEAKAVLQAVH